MVRKKVIMATGSEFARFFAWDDPFDLNGQLTEDERFVRDPTRAFSQKHLAPRASEDYLEERFDRKLAAEMGRAGLFGATLPQQALRFLRCRASQE
jgi:alkylation response protein AidB-like acyl-CoA dehydrogenase